MFSTILDPKELRSTLTDAGHTAAGFAALAAKKAIEVRSDLASRYETQLHDARTNALDMVERVERLRTDLEHRVEPVVAKLTERLPQPAQKAIADLTDARKTFESRAHDFVVKTINGETPTMPFGAPATAAAAGTKAATAKPSARTAKRSTSKPSKPAAKPAATSTKPAAKSAAASARKATARRARTAA